MTRVMITSDVQKSDEMKSEKDEKGDNEGKDKGDVRVIMTKVRKQK